MIALVSSTIKPSTKVGVSLYSYEERLEQTKLTITRLTEHGFTEIFLIDNSHELDQQQLEKLLPGFNNLKVYHIRHYQFTNKGLNELLMLLYLTDVIPLNRQIFKISGRYYPVEGFQKPDFIDFAVKWYDPDKKLGAVSTRGYWIKDAQTLQQFLLRCLQEWSVYSYRITGPVSLAKRLIKKNTEPLNISIELAAANVFRIFRYKVTLLENIGIEGLVAGVGHYEKISE
jgi:hypothetical protein